LVLAYGPFLARTLRLAVIGHYKISLEQFQPILIPLSSRQTTTRLLTADVTTPKEIWDGMFIPLVDGADGLVWTCNAQKEVLEIEENGLHHLDYMFGAGTANFYNWKERTWALHSRSHITKIVFTYNFKNHILKVETHQKFN
jgi:hypothetical protein